MKYEDTFYLSLTGKNSHKVTIKAGHGNLTIGATGISKGKHDAWVDEDALISWNALEEHDHRKDIGWPRGISYEGNDNSFIEWADKRPIQGFVWKPTKDVVADLTNANIRSFELHVDKGKVDLTLSEKVSYVRIHGNLENVTFVKCPNDFALSFRSFQKRQEKPIYQLPLYPNASGARDVSVLGEVDGEPFDCSSLLQFTCMKSLCIYGNAMNLSALAKLEHLESINLQRMSNLEGMPKLETWKNLKHFYVDTIEETVGKQLKAELKVLQKEREFSEYSGVYKLKKAIWFTTEYNIPFSKWEDKKGKAAKSCLKEMRKAKSESDAHQAIVTFVTNINNLEDIETEEREGVFVAVGQLVEFSGLDIGQEMWAEWFDDVRDF